MFIFLTILTVAISLSLDTFSLSLSYGLFNISSKDILRISLCVGTFHFIMPLLGNFCGKIIFDYIPMDEKTLIGIIFLTISFELILSFFKEKEITPIKTMFDILIFSFTVSIDSFATGTCLNIFKTNNFVVVTVFMLISFLFTYCGLSMGSFLNNKIGRIAQIIGLILLISLSIFYLVY